MSQNFAYKNRIVDNIITEQLEAAGMILILGIGRQQRVGM